MCGRKDRDQRHPFLWGQRAFIAEGAAMYKERHGDGKLWGMCGKQTVVWFGWNGGNQGLKLSAIKSPPRIGMSTEASAPTTHRSLSGL